MSTTLDARLAALKDGDTDANRLPDTTAGVADYIACPWCNGRHRDLWEFGDGMEGDFEVECHYDCGGVFTLSRRVSVDYYAIPLRKESRIEVPDEQEGR